MHMKVRDRILEAERSRVDCCYVVRVHTVGPLLNVGQQKSISAASLLVSFELDSLGE